MFGNDEAFYCIFVAKKYVEWNFLFFSHQLSCFLLLQLKFETECRLPRAIVLLHDNSLSKMWNIISENRDKNRKKYFT